MELDCKIGLTRECIMDLMRGGSRKNGVKSKTLSFVFISFPSIHE